MARHKPAAGESVPVQALPLAATPFPVSEASAAKAIPRRTRTAAPPSVERIAGVRIIRGGEWTGISLRLADGAVTGQLLQPDLMELSLVTADGRSIIIATVDGDEAVAVWRAASAASGLAMMVETADGLLQAPFPQIGRLALGPIRIRRAHGAMHGRRPRFLTRRKTACLPERPVMVHGVVLSGEL
jgi:Family of unknown function (DUF6101)